MERGEIHREGERRLQGGELETEDGKRATERERERERGEIHREGERRLQGGELETEEGKRATQRKRERGEIYSERKRGR